MDYKPTPPLTDREYERLIEQFRRGAKVVDADGNTINYVHLPAEVADRMLSERRAR